MRFGKIGEWKLVDFGSAHRAGERADHVAHSKRYCPPEVATAMVRGNGRAAMCVAPSLDVWASALVLYELFHGAPLLPADVDYTAIVGGVRLPAASLTDAQLRLLQGALAPDAAARPSAEHLLAKHLFRPAQDTVERQRVEVAAFFSDPRGDLKLMREIQSLLSAFVDCRNRTGYEVCPAARLSDVQRMLDAEVLPRLVSFSPQPLAGCGCPSVRGRRGRVHTGRGAEPTTLAGGSAEGSCSDRAPRAPRARLFLNASGSRRPSGSAASPRRSPTSPSSAGAASRSTPRANVGAKAFYTALATETNCRVSRAFDAGRAAAAAQGVQGGRPGGLPPRPTHPAQGPRQAPRRLEGVPRLQRRPRRGVLLAGEKRTARGVTTPMR